MAIMDTIYKMTVIKPCNVKGNHCDAGKEIEVLEHDYKALIISKKAKLTKDITAEDKRIISRYHTSEAVVAENNDSGDEESLQDLTNDQLRAVLNDLKVSYGMNENKAQLIVKIEEARAKEAA